MKKYGARVIISADAVTRYNCIEEAGWVIIALRKLGVTDLTTVGEGLGTYCEKKNGELHIQFKSLVDENPMRPSPLFQVVPEAHLFPTVLEIDEHLVAHRV